MPDSISGAKPLDETLALAARFGALVPPTVVTTFGYLLDQNDETVAGRTEEIRAFFAARGGKLITLAGLEDGNVPPLTVAEHYRRAVGTLGAETVTNFFVHSLVPGCREAAGDPAALRGVIQDWVERDIRPGAL